MSSGNGRLDLETKTKTKTKHPDQVVKEKRSSHHLQPPSSVEHTCLSGLSFLTRVKSDSPGGGITLETTSWNNSNKFLATGLERWLNNKKRGGAPAALAEHLGSSPSTHMLPHNYL